jgi:hypothetical protein
MVDSDIFLLIRSARRTLALEIMPDAAVLVRAPRRTPMKQIHHFIASHGDWISRKQAAVLERPRTAAKEYVEGEEFLFLGGTCRLSLVDAPSPEIDFDGRLCLSRHALPRARETLVKWYKAQARKAFSERVEKYAPAMGCQPAAIRITSPQRRWGSCGATGSLNLNWRLVMAPREVIEYVVVHELAHLKHRHHGRDFWDFVEAFAPDYRRHRKWLKDNGHHLEV